MAFSSFRNSTPLPLSPPTPSSSGTNDTKEDNNPRRHRHGGASFPSAVIATEGRRGRAAPSDRRLWKTGTVVVAASFALAATAATTTILAAATATASTRTTTGTTTKSSRFGGNEGLPPLLLRRGTPETKDRSARAATDAGGSLAIRRSTRQQPQREMQTQTQTAMDDNNNNNNTALLVCDLDYCLSAFENDTLCPEKNTTTAEQEPPTTSGLASIPMWGQMLMLAVLLAFSALFSGLTLGLMSLDITGLEIVMAGDDPVAAKHAETIYPLRKRGNLLLCTLLLGNVAVNSLMSIFSAAIFDGTTGFLSSTFLIVIFGEIIPQALCSRYALQIGSAAVPIVKVIRFLLFVLSYPLAKALDFMLGRELATTYSNAEMIELLNVHVKENIIDQEEANAMAGALTYKNIQVKDAMTAIEQTFMLEVDYTLSFETIGKIFKTGYSRIPVYEISRNNVIGLLFVKDLIFLDPEDCVPVRSFIQIFGRNAHKVWPDSKLGDVLAALKKGRSHLALVQDVNQENESQDPFYEVKGIITLEDIVERIIGDSIVDETDAFVDNGQQIKVERGETFEWARLRLLDTKIVDEMLTSSEISAVTAHLKTNHAEPFQMLTDSQITRLVSSTQVTTFPTATQELHKDLPNDLLYQKNVPSDTFTLILSGKITIFVGSENFRSDVSSWSVLGSSALHDMQWKPDYTAFVSDGPCRCIQIHRDSFVEAMDSSFVERRTSEYATMGPSLSVTSSNDGDGKSITSSKGSKVEHNRRKTILARLFSSQHNLVDYGDDLEDDDDGDDGSKISKTITRQSSGFRTEGLSGLTTTDFLQSTNSDAIPPRSNGKNQAEGKG